MAACYYLGMMLQIEVTRETEARLREHAAAAGKELFAYASELVERAAAQPDLDAILAPLRERFKSSGVTDEELVQDITAAQTDYRSENRKKTA